VRLEDLGCCCRVLISRKRIAGPCCMEDADGLQQTTSPSNGEGIMSTYFKLLDCCLFALGLS
jgi:hypothetical protein